jgi:hypothetical protein
LPHSGLPVGGQQARATTSAAFNDRANDGATVTGIGTTEKQPTFLYRPLKLGGPNLFVSLEGQPFRLLAQKTAI